MQGLKTQEARMKCLGWGLAFCGSGQAGAADAHAMHLHTCLYACPCTVPAAAEQKAAEAAAAKKAAEEKLAAERAAEEKAAAEKAAAEGKNHI